MIDASEALDRLADQTILVTGAAGSVGDALVRELEFAGCDVLASDLTTIDVRHPFSSTRDILFHLAAAKHAPHGEDDPFDVAWTNIVGTQNALEAGPRVVLASTCKACDPETAYGASKLIAERMTLNAGGSVARFYNIPESSGNVFRLWESLPADEPLPVSPCSRYFVSLADAVALLLWAAVLPAGRYSVEPGSRKPMLLVAKESYPGRAVDPIPARRGDRLAEPLLGSSERIAGEPVPGIVRVESPHDVFCPNCLDSGAVCENHPDRPWPGLTGGAECCGGAGMPCPICCSEIPQDGTRSIVEGFVPDRLRA